MEKFQEYLKKAEELIYTADHMTYVSYPVVREKRLLLKILSEINLSILNTINAILYYEYIHKKIILTKNAESNLDIFIKHCAPIYQITQNEINLILDLFNTVKKHKESPFEFSRNEKVVILSENMTPKVITLEKTKEFLQTSKNILKKAKYFISQNLR